MSLSSGQLRQILNEIGETLTGGALHKVDQPQPWSVLFELHHRAKRSYLYFSAHRRHARFHLLEKKYDNPGAAPRFSLLLRAHLRYKRVVSLEQLNDDRIIRMKCAWAGEGPSAPLSFIAELMGPASNFYLVDPEGKILGSLFPPSEKRALRIGGAYLLPPVSRALSFKEAPVPSLDAGPFPWNRSVEVYYRALEAGEASADQEKKLFAEIDTQIRRHRKKLDQLGVGMAEAEKFETYRLQGELLKSHLHEIGPGMKELRCADPSQPPGAETLLSLDPSLSPSQNLERIFKRYRKAQSARSSIRVQIQKTTEALDRLERDRKTLLEGGKVELPGGPISPRRSARAEKSAKTGAPAYLSKDGLTLLVGRNDRENDEITFRVARGNDLWFHARGVPGSHVVVRMERREEIPYQTLLDAATLALHFSGGRKTGKGDVLYTFRKYVQKPKGEKPGRVVCSQEKNIYIEIETARLDRLLQNRVGAG